MDPYPQPPTNEAEPKPETAAASEDSSSSSSSSSKRSYECTFCKRGFSNAQALGGHMNIHRKDRAKLKQPPIHCQFPFNMAPMMIPSTYLPQLAPNPNPRQLPLFGEIPSLKRDVGSLKEVMQSDERQHGAEAVELDLELRLGPEPDAKTMSLKEFI